MTGVNDENTREYARSGYDAVTTFLTHFSQDDATWDSFKKTDYFLEYLRLHMLEMLHSVEAELQRRVTAEPTEFGT